MYAARMIGIGGPELIIIFLIFLPLICVLPAYRLAKKKGYGQLVAAGTVAATFILAYLNIFLALVPLVFFLLAPDRTE